MQTRIANRIKYWHKYRGSNLEKQRVTDRGQAAAAMRNTSGRFLSSDDDEDDDNNLWRKYAEHPHY